MTTPREIYGGYEVAWKSSSRVSEEMLDHPVRVASLLASPLPAAAIRLGADAKPVPDRVRLLVFSTANEEEEGALSAVRRQIDRYRLVRHDALPPVLEVFEHAPASEDGSPGAELCTELVAVMPHDEGVRLDRLRRFLARDYLVAANAESGVAAVGDERLPDPAVWFIGWRLFGALAAGHLARDENGLLMPLIHGALTMRQVLVTATGELRLYGLCALLDWDDALADDKRGAGQDGAQVRASIVPQAWWAPEVRQGNTAHPPSDVYSAALILRTLLAGLPQPIPGASIEPLVRARPDLPGDITEALDRAVLREDGQSAPSAADLSFRFEGLVRVTEGKKALRATMDLRRAIGGLWSVSAPEPDWAQTRAELSDVAPASGRAKPHDTNEDFVVLEDAELDEATLERLQVLSEPASPESLQILDEATNDVVAEVEGLIAREFNEMPPPLPVPALPDSESYFRRPISVVIPPPLPPTEPPEDPHPHRDEPSPEPPDAEPSPEPPGLAPSPEPPAADSSPETLDAAPLTELPNRAPPSSATRPQARGSSAETLDPEPLAEIAEPPDAAVRSERQSKSHADSQAPATSDAPVAPAPPEPLEREKRDSAAPIELKRLAAPVLGEGDDLGPLEGTLDDTQPDVPGPISAARSWPFLRSDAILRRAHDELDAMHSEEDAPSVAVTGHFEVAGDPGRDSIGDLVARLAPRKRRTLTLQDARRARRERSDDASGRRGTKGGTTATSDGAPDRQLPPSQASARPLEDQEGGAWSRWGVFAAVAISAVVSLWYGSSGPSAESSPRLGTDDGPRAASSAGDAMGANSSIAGGFAPAGAMGSSVPTSEQSSVPTSAPSPVMSAPSVEPMMSMELPDESELLSFQAFLIIVSSVDAEVVLKGKPVGPTNRKNLVRCGRFKHVRLRRSAPDDARWLTVGESIPVPCMRTTTHKIEPDSR